MKSLAVLGSTGSIGVSTLDVVARHPNRFKIVALTANAQFDRMLEQCRKFSPRYAVMVDEDAAQQLADQLKQQNISDVEVLSGVEGLEKVASLPEVDFVMAAIVGAAGLLPTLAAAKQGKRILLANKESLVMSGRLFMDAIRDNDAELLPIDSEHNAIFQCMPSVQKETLPQNGVTRILLTSSGGPFLFNTQDELGHVTPDQACAHPNWSMGRKISVDSASMMNKGLEVIEAHWLFNADADDIQVVVHPQSVIHSMVEYTDGSVLAQLGNPDMRTPIAHAMAWPERIESGVKQLNIFDVARLDFEAPDFERFPCLRLAYDALRAGGTSTCILNAANEIAVESFLNETISFLDIPKVIEKTLNDLTSVNADSLEIVLTADQSARDIARICVEEINS
jgi:1-deoxy-D-xylulose-5-phosphate reductoisomerase